MTWINVIAHEKAAGKLKKLYERIKGPGDNVDNIMLAHSLRPHTMEGHMTLYKYVLHHDDGEVLELNQVTAYFSYANRTVLGLGVNTEGDIIGLSPGDSDDLSNWSHS